MKKKLDMLFSKAGYHRLLLLLFALMGMTQHLYSQQDTLLGVYQSSTGAKVEIRASKPFSPCTPTSPDWKIMLRPFNLKKLSSKQRFLSFRIPLENCSGYQIDRAFSFDLRTFKADSLDEVVCETRIKFEAVRILKPLKEMRVTQAELVGFKDKMVTRILPAPTSISGMDNAILGEPLVLKVLSPDLPEDAQWVWYLNACDSIQPFKTGSSIEFTPEDTTVLYVRSQADIYRSPCEKVLIIPKEKPKPTVVSAIDSAMLFPPKAPLVPKKKTPVYITYGLGLATFDKLTSNMPPFWFAAEFPLKIQPNLLVGVVGGLSAHWYKVSNASQFFVGFPTIGIRSKLIFTEFIPDYKERNLPFQGYAGLSLNVTGKWTNWGYQYSEPDYYTRTGIVTGIHLGGNYRFSAHSSVFAELNSTIAPLSIGISIHNFENGKL